MGLQKQKMIEKESVSKTPLRLLRLRKDEPFLIPVFRWF